jgi:hypothetical protein
MLQMNLERYLVKSNLGFSGIYFSFDFFFKETWKKTFRHLIVSRESVVLLNIDMLNIFARVILRHWLGFRKMLLRLLNIGH